MRLRQNINSASRLKRSILLGFIASLSIFWGQLNAQDPGLQPILEAPQQGDFNPNQFSPPPDFTPILEEEDSVGKHFHAPEFLTMDYWDFCFELGINGNAGNSDSLNVQTGLELERKNERYINTVKLRYNNAYADDVEVKNNASMQANHEKILGDTPWSWFIKSDLFYDEFKAFDLRWVINSGLGYAFINEESTKLKGRFGLGTSREFGGPDDHWAPEALLGIDYKRQITKQQKFSATADYYPDLSDFSDFRFISNVSWELLMDAEANLSLKLSVIDEYDSTPNGAEPNDVNYAFLLLWKF